eukprot:CAMPEP_0117559252 /NCGR_PEP_ID=MMETSP0784-20121206/53262_1 /TAXON_ID=39447 /ORGANISM="" /LENGTH=134 /DNA_ID=CAMNT_0005356619 /DNA_START=55 /DNA_END=456 /DNA_ORIENTATION=-
MLFCGVEVCRSTCAGSQDDTAKANPVVNRLDADVVDVEGQTVTPMPVIPSKPRKDAVASMQSQLAGAWIDDTDKVPVGIIKDDEVVWHSSYDSPPTTIIYEPPFIILDLDGQHHRGHLDVTTVIKLRWSDGEVW